MAYPVFKGATRPILVLGVPQVPLFFACAIITIICAVIDLTPIAIPISGIAIFIMSKMAKKDEYIFRQLFLNFVMNKARNFNRRIWGKGIYSFSPVAYRKFTNKRKD